MIVAAAVAAGVSARLLRLQELTFKEEFDAVWACASLLHVPRNEIDDVLRRVTRAMRPGGRLYASFKKGEGELTRGGRLFNNNYTLQSAGELIAGISGLQLLRGWERTGLRPGRAAEVWVNFLAKRD